MIGLIDYMKVAKPLLTASNEARQRLMERTPVKPTKLGAEKLAP